MSTLSTRLAEALEAAQLTAPYKNKAGLAKHCGLQSVIHDGLVLGERRRQSTTSTPYAQPSTSASMRPGCAEGIGAMRSTSVQVYEDTGEGAALPDPNYIVIPQYHVQASAGPGNENPVFEEVDGKECGFIKPRWWFQLHQINPENCKTFEVHGDSMEPYLWDGDKILVDCTPTDIISGKVYVFMIHGKMRVKVLRLPDQWTAHPVAQSGRCPTRTISGADMQTFHLIGRVRDRSGGSWL